MDIRIIFRNIVIVLRSRKVKAFILLMFFLPLPHIFQLIHYCLIQIVFTPTFNVTI